MGIPFYIGTYTPPASASKGIYRTELDPATGVLSTPELVAEIVRPGFLARHPSGRWLYAVGETAGGASGAPVHAFAVKPDGGLTFLNTVQVPGEGACHLCVCGGDEPGAPAAVAVACYRSGTVSAVPVLPGGGLGACQSWYQHEGQGPHPTRQTGPHAHAVYWRPSRPGASRGRVYAVDLGLDAVFAYPLDAATAELSNDPALGAERFAFPPGCGPRHIAFDPAAADTWYVINELDATVSTWKDGALRQTVPSLPPTVDLAAQKVTAAEIELHPNRRWLYVSNRGCETLGRMDLDPATGVPALAETVDARGAGPRSFALAPGGGWLVVAHQNGNSLAVFRIDPADGRMTPVGDPVALGSPVCVLPW